MRDSEKQPLAVRSDSRECTLPTREGTYLMKRCQPHLVRTGIFLLFLLATVPAYCQRGTIDINAGETSDKFGALAPVTGGDLDINGELTVKKPSAKNGGPSIVAGGEVRVPTDDTNHAKEFAVFGGHSFPIGHQWRVDCEKTLCQERWPKHRRRRRSPRPDRRHQSCQGVCRLRWSFLSSPQQFLYRRPRSGAQDRSPGRHGGEPGPGA